MLLVTQHAESVLRITRRFSLCDADADDAYQRAIEILLRHAGRLDPERAASWLRTVAKHEAIAIRAQRTDGVQRDDHDPDEHVAGDLTPTEEQVARVDRFARAAEALRDLKPDETRALWLRAEGYSYAEIAESSSWTYTKVNRLLAEGRTRFLSRYASIESGGACSDWQPVLSAIVDGEADPQARADVAVHLRSCLGCRATLRHLRSSTAGIRMVLPPVGLLVTYGHSRPSGGAATRFLETAWAGLHDRAATAAMSAQGAVEGLNAGKVAAVTASVAALAGGGAVAVEHRAASPSPASHATRDRAEEHAVQAGASATGPTSSAAAPTTVPLRPQQQATVPVKPASPRPPAAREPASRRTEFHPDEAADTGTRAGEFRRPDEFAQPASGTSAARASSTASSSSSASSFESTPESPRTDAGEFGNEHRGEFAP